MQCFLWRLSIVAGYFFIGKAEKKGDAVALLTEDNAVRWKNRSGGLPEYKRDSVLGGTGVKMTKEMEARITKILAEMTVQEKIGQLNQQAEPRSDEEIALCKQKIRNGEVGSIILTASSTAGNEKKSQKEKK